MAPNPLAPSASPIPATPAVVAVLEGERSRLHGRSDPAQWHKAAAAWLTLGRPYPAAYAQWRQAEALLATKTPRGQAEETLRAAHAVAVRLGRHRCDTSWSCSPNAAAYGWSRQPTQQQPSRGHPRWLPPSG
jgi:hypothetical protein